MTFRPQRRTRTVTVLVAVALVASTVFALGTSLSATAATSTPVMGSARVSAASLAGWYRSKGKTTLTTVSIDTLAAYFIAEGADEGVAGDVAFAQSIVETGFFRFGGRVLPGDNNFSGLGAVDGGTGAATFPDARTGVRAQMQHLRAYGDPAVTVAKLAHPVVDPRFSLVAPKGKAPTWEQFGSGIWATDTTYAAKVLGTYQQILDWAAANAPTTTTTTTTVPTTTTTTIVLPPPVRTYAPFDSSQELVAQAHRDLLAREATAGEVAAGASALDGGVFDPGGYLATLVAGEGADHAEPVVRLYLAALGRLPDRSGLQYWTRRHAEGVRLTRLADQFLDSSEFQRRYGAPSDLGFIEVLYRNVLDRPSDPNGADYWARRLQADQIDRSGLLVQFSESAEHIRVSQVEAEASVVYVGMVLREPDPSVLSWWAAKRASGASLDVLTRLVFESAAYQQRFAA